MKYTRICACITAVAALISLACCKPTEKNYRLAYELAQQKARENLDDAEYAMMLEEEQPPLVHAGDDSIRARTLPLMWQYSPQSLDSGRRADPLRYNLAVGMYTMLTNAKAHADKLCRFSQKLFYRSCPAFEHILFIYHIGKQNRQCNRNHIGCRYINPKKISLRRIRSYIHQRSTCAEKYITNPFIPKYLP